MQGVPFLRFPSDPGPQLRARAKEGEDQRMTPQAIRAPASPVLRVASSVTVFG